MTEKKEPAQGGPQNPKNSNQEQYNTARDRVARALANMRGQKARLLQFVFNNPDRFTHEAERECAIGYAPARVLELNRALEHYGLQIVSYLPDPARRLVNRFGQVTMSHRLRVELFDARSE